MSRPKTEINWETVDKMLAAGCLGTEIASHFGMHADTFYKKIEVEKKMGFTAYCQQKRSKGNALIRLAQFDEAVNNRDRAMLIWLGKNRLGQSEKESVEHKGDIPIQIVSYNGKELKPWKEDE